MGQSEILSTGRPIAAGSAVRTLAALLCVAAPLAAHAENVDPQGDDAQYSWAENAGWINAEPLGDGGPGLVVSDAALTGWMWGENTGWISLSCQNTSNCDLSGYGVANDGAGVLSGRAWGENTGWISFSCSSPSLCTPYGVVIDPSTGAFSGRAWAENIGWISFSGASPSAWSVTTSWRPAAVAGPGAVPPTLTVSPVSGTVVNLAWTASCGAGAADYAIYEGEIGNWYSHTLVDCSDDGGDLNENVTPAPGNRYFLVVPHDAASVEGSYGKDALGVERPRGATTCQAAQTIGQCP